MATLKQEVQLRIYDAQKGGNLILDASGLRCDFDVRLLPEFSRATFTIYNLNDKTISALTQGDKYVTLKTRLHGVGRFETLAERYYISNVVDELNVPNRLTKLFCFDALRQEVLEKRVNITVGSANNPATLRNLVQRTIESTGFIGEDTFLSFPSRLLDRPMLKTKRPMNGSAQECLRVLEREFDFLTYTINGGFTFLHAPSLDTAQFTRLRDKVPDVVLHTNEMRSNPKIGMASASIESNLNPRIQPGTVLDLSQLVTIGVDADVRKLQVVDNFLSRFSGYSKYQAFAVGHSGSNYTDRWTTTTTAYSPTKGKLMPTVKWASKTY